VTVEEAGEEDRVAVQVSGVMPWPILLVWLLSTVKDTFRVAPEETETVWETSPVSYEKRRAPLNRTPEPPSWEIVHPEDPSKVPLSNRLVA
jgi:hypothetical protein